ncbi:MAG: hypothetical protein NTY50_22740, partial [Methylobacter sp.]|nr:hypothetical protein [Methylobacter sp.]
FSAGPAFPASRGLGVPETPTLAIAGRAYSGLRPCKRKRSLHSDGKHTAQVVQFISCASLSK